MFGMRLVGFGSFVSILLLQGQLCKGMQSQTVLKEENLLLDGDFVVADALLERYSELKLRRKREVDDGDIAVARELEERYKALHQDHYTTKSSELQENQYKYKNLRKRSIDNEFPWTIELAVFADNAMYRYVKEKYPGENITEVITEYIMAMISSVQMYLNQESSGQTFHIEIVWLEIFEETDGLQEELYIRSYLDKFCEWQNSRKSSSGLSWDHALLLTGLNLISKEHNDDDGASGMAYLSGMCSSGHSCTIGEGRSPGTSALIFAHELGHNLGVEHDGLRDINGESNGNNCDAEKYLMGPRLNAGASQWSPCSKEYMEHFLDLYGGCLKNDRNGEKTKWDHQSLSLPGEQFDGDEQCHMLYGAGWVHYIGRVDSIGYVDGCESLWCYKYMYLRSPNAGALQGTGCGFQKHCLGGKCMEKEVVQETKAEKIPEPKVIEEKPKRPNTFGFSSQNNVSVCELFRMLGIQFQGCS